MNFNPLRKVKKIAQRSFLFRWYAERTLAEKRFRLGEQEYNYLIHRHNHTWTNERAVELAIAEKALHEHQSKRVLEVGNVTRHYLSTNHEVVDKYEKADGVINLDIVDYTPEEKYDFVFAISTLEHVGWDRDQREPEKIPVAVEKLKELLAPNGQLLITVPVGFNFFLDAFIEHGDLGFDTCRFLKRKSLVNEWEEADWDNVKNVQYNSPFNNANAIAVATYQKAA